MELKRPFEEYIWNGLWDKEMRRNIKNAVKTGVTVIEDKEFKYKNIFTDMLAANFRRHGNKRELTNEMNIVFRVFKDKIKLYIALRDNKPIVGLLCFYTASICDFVYFSSYSRNTDNISKVCFKAAMEYACNASYSFFGAGVSMRPGEAFFKRRLGFELIPSGMYIKTYSVLRNRIRQVLLFVEQVRRDRAYLWHNWKKY